MIDDDNKKASWKEDELHLWVGGGDEDWIELMVQFNENEELEISLPMGDKKQACVLAPNQWKLLQAFLKHGGPFVDDGQ